MSVNVGLVGVGNCASALVQGRYWYESRTEPGLMTESVQGWEVGDLRFACAFDVDERKVGLDLSQAVFAETNNTLRFQEVPYLDVTVVAGPVLDGIGRSLSSVVGTTAGVGDVVAHLKATKTDVLVNYLPVGSQMATEFYAECALAAGCGFVNAIPVRIASDPTWAGRFAEARLPIIGDDVRSQVGATIVHQELARIFSERGVRLDRTYQLNVGGNTDFLNMKDEDRLVTKRESKAGAVLSVANRGKGLRPEDVHIGPSDYIPWLGDRKVALIRMEGSAFGGAPLVVDVRMEVWDSPNSAGVVMDAIRHVAAARQNGDGGVLLRESAELMKSPPEEARGLVYPAAEPDFATNEATRASERPSELRAGTSHPTTISAGRKTAEALGLRAKREEGL